MMDARELREELTQRIPIFKIGFLALLGIVALNFFMVQVAAGSRYLELAENNRLRRLEIQAPRGLMYDREGRILAENVPSYDLFFDTSRTSDPEESFRFASGVLEGVEANEFADVLESHGRASRSGPVLLAEDLTLAEVAQFGVSALEHPEFQIEVHDVRLYRYGPQMAHVLGYVAKPGADDLDRGNGSSLSPDSVVGKAGLEQEWDDGLRGGSGERVVVVDNVGRAKEEHGKRPAVPGRSLRLTLDLDLQQIAARYFEDKVGAAVAMDPRNGEILALVSAPSFNPNIFAKRLEQKEWKALLTTPHNPMQNRAVQNAHAPGSVFKIVMAVAGLMEGVIDTNDTQYCGGSARFYNRNVRCWKRGGHGVVNLRKAIQKSCDVYFYHLGRELEISRIAKYARLFGMGSRTGLGIPGERAGLVPSEEWSVESRGHRWYPGETISVAVGQGPILVSPIQTATMISVIANNGKLVTPHLLKTGEKPPPKAVPLSPQAVEIVREALWAVVNDGGTGTAAAVAGLDVAGKTGTTQVIRQATWIKSEDLDYENRDHGWFASFAPQRNAELVVVVFVEHGGHGGTVAAPLARQIYEKHFENRLTETGSS